MMKQLGARNQLPLNLSETVYEYISFASYIDSKPKKIEIKIDIYALKRTLIDTLESILIVI